MALTTYIILERLSVQIGPLTELEGTANGEPVELEESESEPTDVFRKIGAVNAHSTEQAFRMAGEKHGAGHYAICSERSWNEETLAVETTTRVTVQPS